MYSDEKKSYNNILLDKINSFIKKFYLNKLIQGVLIGTILIIVFYLTFSGIEYFSWFPGKIRFILLVTLISLLSIVSFIYFVIPLINLIRFRKKMSDKDAAILIGRFFPEIKDKYQVMSVPCLVINDGEKISFGKKNIRQLLELI